MTQIKTLDVNAKEWFDKVNGNSYFSATITVNYGMSDQKEIFLPFSYGYGDQYIYASLEELIKQGLTDFDCIFKLRNSGVIIRNNIQRGCKKRELSY